ITSGLLRALQDKGLQDIVEWQDTGRVVSVHDFINGFGAGAGQSLNDPAQDNPPILFPEVHFYTNDSWPVIRGAASAKGFPIVLMNRYSNGAIYLLNIPENIGDLYNLPQGVIAQMKRYIQQDFPVRVESAPHVALFAYDNNAFVVESFRPDETSAMIFVATDGTQLRNLMTGNVVTAATEPPPTPGERATADRGLASPPHTNFSVTIEPHSFLVFGVEPAAASPASSKLVAPIREREQ
ncbi:MAG TPA: hypothetical protein VGM17_13550, partial [Rhizomicrobium sp.]